VAQELLGDANPMVVANALAALSEIKAQGAHDALKFTSVLLFKLLRALNECTEWGQVTARPGSPDLEHLHMTC
jgi:AP-1 complex subunit beta-1